MGSAGSIVGAGEALRKDNKDLVVIGVRRMVDNPIPGPRDKFQLQHVEFDHQAMSNAVEDVDMTAAYQHSLDLSRMVRFWYSSTVHTDLGSGHSVRT